MRRLLAVAIALLPLQWFVVGAGLRLHIVVILALGAALALQVSAADVRRVVAVSRPFIVANAVIVAVWAAANLYHGLGLRPVVQQAAFLFSFVTIAAAVHGAFTRDLDRTARTLRWSAAASVVVLVTALSYSMAVNGVNAGAVFAKTLTTGDPEILQKELFKSAFVGFGFDASVVRGNIRHEVFGALLLAMGLASVAAHLRPPTTSVQRWFFRGSLLLGGLLILLSMSRSVMLAAAVWPLLIQVRYLMAGRVSRNFTALLFAGVALVSGLVALGVAQVIWVRFTQDTSSYDKRDQLISRAFTNLLDSAFAGGVATDSASSHNFVIDTWLRAGVVAAGAAVVVVVVVAWWFGSLTARLPREPAWIVPMTAMLALPLVRFVTAGGGLVPPVSWVTLAVVVGLMAARAELQGREPSGRGRLVAADGPAPARRTPAVR
jgi:hypothetical protein